MGEYIKRITKEILGESSEKIHFVRIPGGGTRIFKI